MRLWTVVCALCVGCDLKVDPPVGEIPVGDLCTLSALVWFGIEGETCADGAPLCYEDLALHVEPMAVGDRALDLALCLSGTVTWTVGGGEGSDSLQHLAETGALSRVTGTDYLVADDGTTPCLGMTAALQGSLEEGVSSTEESFWWKDGTDFERAGEDLKLRVQPGGTVVNLTLPEALSDALGLGSEVILEETTTSRYGDPLCVAAE